MRRILPLVLTHSLGLCLTTPGVASEFQYDIPDEFKDLLGQDQQQISVFDIYYGGSKLGELEATFDQEQITFTRPSQLIKLLPNISDPEQINRVFDESLPTNSALICQSDTANIGVTDEYDALLSTSGLACDNKPSLQAVDQLLDQGVSVLVNPESFRVDIYINARFLQEADFSLRLRDNSTIGWALNNRLNASLSGGNQQDQRFGLNNNLTLSYKNFRINSGVSFDQDQITVNRLVAELDYQDLNYQLGQINSQGIASRELIGVNISRQLEAFKNIDQAYGTPIDIFLSSRALVEIFKDGKRLSSRVYEQGNQRLITDDLPEGIYDITLKITERQFADRNSFREEQRFFIKNKGLAPFGVPDYHFSFGFLKNTNSSILSFKPNPILDAGVSVRANDTMALSFGLTANKEQILFNTSSQYISDRLKARFELAFSSEKEFILGGFANFRYKELDINFNFRKIIANKTDNRSPARTTEADMREQLVEMQQEERFNDLIDNPSTRASLRMSRRFFDKIQTTVQWNYIKNPSSESKLTNSQTLSWPLLTSTKYGRLNLRVQRFDDGIRNRINFGLSYNLPIGKGVTSSNQISGSRSSDGNRSLNNNSSVNWQVFDDLSVGINHSQDRIENRQDIRVNADYRNNFFNYSGNYNRNSDAVTSYFNSLDFNVSSVNQEFYLSREAAQAGVYIKLQGNSRAVFDVLVDRLPVGEINGENQLFVPLTPYQKQSISLKPKDSDNIEFFQYDDRVADIIAYPGNIGVEIFKVEKAYLLITTVIDNNGQPVDFSEISTINEVSFTDEEGFTQITVTRSNNRLRVKNAQGECVVELDIPSDETIEDGILVLDQVICSYI